MGFGLEEGGCEVWRIQHMEKIYKSCCNGGLV